MPPSQPEAVRRRGPSRAKTEATRRDIVAAALDVFCERGFSEARMIDVAERASVAKGTLYLYFADKEALFEGVMGDVLTARIEQLAALGPAEGETVRAFLSRAVAPFVRDMERSKRAGVIRLAIAEGSRFPALAEPYYRLTLVPLFAFVRRLAEQAWAAGEIRTDAPIRYPQLLMAPGLILAVWNSLFTDERRIDGAALFEGYLDLVFGPAEPSPALARSRRV